MSGFPLQQLEGRKGREGSKGLERAYLLSSSPAFHYLSSDFEIEFGTEKELRRDLVVGQVLLFQRIIFHLFVRLIFKYAALGLRQLGIFSWNGTCCYWCSNELLAEVSNKKKIST